MTIQKKEAILMVNSVIKTRQKKLCIDQSLSFRLSRVPEPTSFYSCERGKKDGHYKLFFL